jgi:cell division protease FtsH
VNVRTRTAYHEAGHAVLSAAINDTPSHLSIRPDGGTLGRNLMKMFVRPTSVAQVFLAGFAAEHLLTGRRPRQLDMEVGMALLAHLDAGLVDTFEGIEATDGHGAVRQVLRMGVREVEAELRREVDRLYDIARQSLVTVWAAVDVLAQALLKHEELDRQAIDDILERFSVFVPVLAVQRAHGLITSTSPGSARVDDPGRA